MSTKASISNGPKYRLYYQELLSDQPTSVFLELNDPQKFRVERETFKGKSWDVLVVEIPSEDINKIAIDWIKKKKTPGCSRGTRRCRVGQPRLSLGVVMRLVCIPDTHSLHGKMLPFTEGMSWCMWENAQDQDFCRSSIN